MLTLLPAGLGFLGNRAFVEAKASDYRDVMDLVRRELAKVILPHNSHSECWVDITAFYPASGG